MNKSLLSSLLGLNNSVGRKKKKEKRKEKDNSLHCASDYAQEQQLADPCLKPRVPLCALCMNLPHSLTSYFATFLELQFLKCCPGTHICFFRPLKAHSHICGELHKVWWSPIFLACIDRPFCNTFRTPRRSVSELEKKAATTTQIKMLTLINESSVSYREVRHFPTLTRDIALFLQKAIQSRILT